MNTFGEKILQFGLIALVLWVGFNKIKENWPTPSPEEVASNKREAAEKEISQSPKVYDFILYPGQNKKIATNHRNVMWKTAGGPALVREWKKSWYGEWKEDLPGRGTPFDWQIADTIEFFVPPKFPNPVRFLVTIPGS